MSRQDNSKGSGSCDEGIKSGKDKAGGEEDGGSDNIPEKN
jgi:hypothetical protein